VVSRWLDAEERRRRAEGTWSYGGVDAPMSAERHEEAEPPTEPIQPDD
jgi:hypothetical protein